MRYRNIWLRELQENRTAASALDTRWTSPVRTTFNAPPDGVWNAADGSRRRLPPCISGLRWVRAGRARIGTRPATERSRLAAISGTYEGTVVITEKTPPGSIPIERRRRSSHGIIKGNVAIALQAEGATTVVDVNGTVETGGTIARLGQRLIGNVASMMQDRFFACLHRRSDSGTPTSRQGIAREPRSRFFGT